MIGRNTGGTTGTLDTTYASWGGVAVLLERVEVLDLLDGVVEVGPLDRLEPRVQVLELLLGVQRLELLVKPRAAVCLELLVEALLGEPQESPHRLLEHRVGDRLVEVDV